MIVVIVHGRLRLTKGSSSSSELLSFGRHKKDDVRPLKLRSPLSVSYGNERLIALTVTDIDIRSMS